MNNPKKKFGLALSGGGYRAATYHLGTMRALNELKVLDKLDVVATNSGGSITGAYYALNHDTMNYQDFEKNMLANLRKNTLLRALFHPRCLIGAIYLIGLIVLIGVSISIWHPLITWGLIVTFLISILFFQFLIFPISIGIRAAYSAIFFGNKTLKDFCNKPLLVMNATNVETGKLWSFSKIQMEDSTYSRNLKPAVLFKPELFPVSAAVNASSCVPFAFTPVHIEKKYFANPDDTGRVHPLLVDGGVYDNQGVHKLIQPKSKYECDTIIVSDAGNPMKWKSNQRNAFALLIRMMDIFMLRIKNVQMIAGVFENTRTIGANRNIGYFGLSMDPHKTVPFFIEDMFRKGLLTADMIAAQGLEGQEHKTDEELIAIVKSNIKWNEIEPLIPTPKELVLAQGVSTNLWTLSQAKTDALIKHSYCMTLIFMRLYCPNILNNN